MLLVLPFGRKTGWASPPLITIFLILTNCFVFFVLQKGDDTRWATAVNFYFNSPLPSIELPAYADYLDRTGKHIKAKHAQLLLGFGKKSSTHLLINMQHDRLFMHQLQNDQIIRADDPAYSDWKYKRADFDARTERIVTWEYSFYQDRPITYLTSMFLHNGISHLLENMLLLLIVGIALERTLGHTQFFGSYLIGGLLSIGLWALVHGDKGGLGASGAIAALVGLYWVLFHTRKIWFFYWLGSRTGYFKAPAIVLLPFWLSNELYTFFVGAGGASYVAHIGGFIGGAIIGLLQTKVLKSADVRELEESAPQPTPVDGVS